MATKQVKIFVHSDKESNLEQGEEIGLTGDALKLFMYAVYEVELLYDVNMETGEVNLVAVDGRKFADSL